MPFDAFGVYLYDERRDELKLEYAVGYPDREAGFRIKGGEGIVGRAVAQREPIVVGDAASDPYYINHDLRRHYLLKTAVAAIVNIGLNLVLIPRLGPVGAAWATLVAYTSSAILIGALSPRTRPLFRIQLRALLGFPSPHPIVRSITE